MPHDAKHYLREIGYALRQRVQAKNRENGHSMPKAFRRVRELRHDSAGDYCLSDLKDVALRARDCTSGDGPQSTASNLSIVCLIEIIVDSAGRATEEDVPG
ncbi:hypothetical protein MMC30_006063 [Trapelia coarctata]|nr:hypothetical protein [Trapelia coarctata]